jgi:hypothetical protein
LVVVLDRPDGHPLRESVQQLLGHADLHLVLVAGAADAATLGWASELAEAHGAACSLLTVEPAVHTGEAVRRGLLAALERSPDIAGYVSDQFATPASEVLRLCDVMRARDCSVLLAARVAMLGRDIRRSAPRHYLGRIFAMLASTILRTDIYDTQSGVKLFRSSPTLAAALARPFKARVAFDVELLARLLAGAPGAPPLSDSEIVEIPLQSWDGRTTSVVNPIEAAVALRDLIRIEIDLRARRR